MKKYFLLNVIIIFIVSLTYSQSCLPEGITFSNQQEIDDFPINYPDCSIIQGDVKIEGDVSIFNVIGLSQLSEIQGQLYITDNDRLKNLEGLNNLTYIGDNLLIYDNDSLETLYGLDSLNYIGGDLVISYFFAFGNAKLQNITALSNLQNIGGYIYIGYCNELESLEGLDNISPESITKITICNNSMLTDCATTSICDYLIDPSGEVNIYNNATGCNNPREVTDMGNVDFNGLPFGNYYVSSQYEADNFSSIYPGCSNISGDLNIFGDGVSNVIGLSDIQSVEGSLSIGGYYGSMNNLLSLDGLNNISGIGNDLIIDGAIKINNLSGLENLNAIGGDFTVYYNDSLKNLTGLENLSHIDGSTYIMDNYFLESLDGLQNLNIIGQSFWIEGSWGLDDITALGNLDSVGDEIIISSAGLNNLQGLGNLDTINSYLQISQCESLNSLGGLENLKCIKGKLEISEGSLTDFNGLDNLESLGGLELRDTKIKDFNGLSNLNLIQGDINLVGNDSLLNFSGLENTDLKINNIKITYNDNIESLIGLENIDVDSLNLLEIHNNYSLSICNTSGLCNLLDNLNSKVKIYANDEGCNSVTQIADSCGIQLECLPYGDYIFNSQDEIDSFWEDFSNCSQIKGSLTVYGVDINNLIGLDSIQYVESGFHVSATNVSSIEGFNRLDSIGGSLYLGNNYCPATIAGFNNLIKIGGDIIFTDLGFIQNDCFINLNSIGGDFDLFDCYADDFQFLSNLNSIGGDFLVRETWALKSFNGLESLRNINGKLVVANNYSLQSLSGLDNISPNSIQELRIYNNPFLSECDIESICAYISSPYAEVYVHDNNTDCSSFDELLFNCGVNVPENIYNNNSNVLLIPNPCKNEFSVINIDKSDIKQINIYNLLAQKVMTKHLNSVVIDIGNLETGVYIVELIFNNYKIRKKLVKE